MKLTDIYDPVREDLDRVESLLKERLNGVIRENRISGITDAVLDRAIEHIFLEPGKRLRPALVLLSARAVTAAGVGAISGVRTRAIEEMAAAVELFHSASLVHDDVIDEAEHRRLVVSMNKKFGVKIAILIGDILYSQTFGLLSGLPGVTPEEKITLFRLFADLTEKMCSGEIHEQQVVEGADGLDESGYLKILENKTALLMGMSARCGAMLAGADEKSVRLMDEFGTLFGLAYQLNDDFQDQDSLIGGDIDLLARAEGFVNLAKDRLSSLGSSVYREKLGHLCDYVLHNPRKRAIL